MLVAGFMITCSIEAKLFVIDFMVRGYVISIAMFVKRTKFQK